MRNAAFRALFSTIALIILTGAAASVYASTISGTVYDQKRNGLPYVNVELLSDTYSMLQRAVTDATGRYTFNGLRDGNYYVKVLPLRYDFEEETHLVEIATVSIGARNGTGNSFVMEDFYLKPRKGTIAAAQAEVVVAQEVPKSAKEKYEEAAKLLKKGKSDEAIPLLEGAIKDFPAYFYANDALGQIYFNKNDFEHAAPRLLTATKAYDKSPMTLYMLGVSLGHLNYLPAALIALNGAVNLAPESSMVHIALGKGYLSTKDYKAAETSLLNAKKYSKTPSGELYQLFARLYKATNQYSKAAASLESMLKNGNYSDDAKAELKKAIQEYKAKAVANNEKPNND